MFGDGQSDGIELPLRGNLVPGSYGRYLRAKTTTADTWLVHICTIFRGQETIVSATSWKSLVAPRSTPMFPNPTSSLPFSPALLSSDHRYTLLAPSTAYIALRPIRQEQDVSRSSSPVEGWAIQVQQPSAQSCARDMVIERPRGEVSYGTALKIHAASRVVYV